MPTQGSTHAHTRRRLSPWTVLWSIVAFVVLLALSPAIVYWVWTAGQGRRVEKMLAEIRARGEPMTAEELAKSFPLAPGKEDVTNLWMEGMAELAKEENKKAAQSQPIVGVTGVSEDNLPKIGEPWEQLEASDAYLKQVAGAMDKFHEAARRGGYASFPKDYSKGIGMLLPAVQEMRNPARHLLLELEVRARQGDARGAALALRTLLIAQRTLDREPILVSQFVRMAFAGMGTRALADTAGVVDYSDEELREFQRLLRSSNPQECLRISMIGERGLGQIAMQDPKTLGSDSPGISALNSDRATHLEFMNRYLAAIDEGFPACIRESEKIDDDLREHMSNPLTRMTMIYTSLLLPAGSFGITATAREISYQQAADAGIAIELYRRENGSLPEALTDLAPRYLPSVPLDPYTGKPMLYLKSEKGVTIYSVGKNKVDEGGMIDDKLQSDEGLFFHLKD
jgi:hypothetical protein